MLPTYKQDQCINQMVHLSQTISFQLFASPVVLGLPTSVSVSLPLNHITATTETA